MTNDWKKGWRYKQRTDRNARRRRSPALQRRVRAFKKNSKARGRPKCSVRSWFHCGPLQAHHVGGLKSRRLAWRCAYHNQRAAGNRQGGCRR